MSKGETNEEKVIEIILTNVKDQTKSFVVPGQVCVDRGEVVYFKASDSDAKLIFPNKDLLHPKYQEEPGEKEFIRIKKGDTLKVIINPEAETGIYSYAVITTANKDLAIGGSFPRFIVE